MKLDSKDWKILYELDKNARRSDAEIGKQVGLSREVVSYRIKKLVNLGVINKFITHINIPALGLIIFRVHFKFSSLTKEREKEIQDFIKDKALWMVRTRGFCDFNAAIQTKDQYKFKEFFDSFKLKYGNFIEDYDVAIITKMHLFKKKYLLKDEIRNDKVDIWEPIKKDPKLDELDLTILKVIENNARMSSLDVAEKCKTSERVIRYRIKKLTEKNVIIGFRAVLDINKFGYMYVKVQLKLENMTEEAYKKLYEYLKVHKNVVYITESIGGPDYEVEYQVENTKKLYGFVDELREMFEDNIVSWRWIEYIDEIKFSYLEKI